MKGLFEYYSLLEKKSARGGKDTATVAELAQAYACAICSNVKKSLITEDDINSEMISQAKKYVISRNRKTIITSLSPEWKSIIVSIANKLFKEGYSIPNGIYHRNDSFMLDIYVKATTAFKNSGVKFINADKWNPGDIWISSPTLNMKNAPVDSIESYNNWIKEKFESKELISISLKKLGKIKDPNITIFNADEFITPVYYNGFSYKEGKVDKASGFFGNKHVYLFGKEKKPVKMQGRTFESTKFTAYALEVMEKAAAGGKVGWTIIRSYIEEFIGKTGLPGYKQIADLAKNDINKLIEEIYLLYTKHNNSKITLDEFSNKINKDPYRLFSQYYNLLIVDVLETNKGDKADKVFEGVYNHASSKIQNSSIYLKVS